MVDDGDAPTLPFGPEGDALPPTVNLSGGSVLSASARSDQDYDDLDAVDDAHYRLEGELAHGGQGRILKARDRRLGRDVVVKQLRDFSPELVARFTREARITARLQHPGIVSVYEAGRFANGRPFYAMRHVDGRSLHSVIQATRTLDERLALLPHVLRVVEAIAYAHSRRVIHRDLKPDNVLVGPFGETVVIDWGLAKELGDEDSAATVPDEAAASSELTLQGSVMGTPAYMPPEQAAGESVDERADVYALGAMLYHVLAGEPPYRAHSADTLIRRVLAGPPEGLSRRDVAIPPDLLAIVERAMAREKAHRYASAGDVASELERFLTGRLVTAHVYTRRERLGRLIRKHRAAFVVAAVSGTLLAAVATVSVVGILREARLKETALGEAIRRADALTLEQARSSLDVDPLLALQQLASLSDDAEEWAGARTIAADAVSRGIPRVIDVGGGWVDAMAVAPDGSALVTGSQDGGVRRWDLDTLEAVTLPGHDGRVSVVAYGHEQIATGGDDGLIRVWGLSAAEARELVAHDGAVWDLAFGRGSRWPNGFLVSGHQGGSVIAWPCDTWEPVLLGRAGGIVADVEVSPDGRWVAAAGHDGCARVWDLEGGSMRVLDGHDREVTSLAFSPDGARLATTSEDATARVWSLAGDRVEVLRGHNLAVMDAVFGNEELFTASDDGTIRRWRGSGEEQVLRGHEGYIPRLALSPDRLWLASAGFDGTVRLWGLAGDTGRTLRGHRAYVMQVAFTESGVASSSRDGTVRLWPVAPRGTRTFRMLPKGAYDQEFSPGGGVLVIATQDGVVRIFLADGRTERALLRGQIQSWVVLDDGTVVGVDEEGLWRWRPNGSREDLASANGPSSAARSADGGAVIAVHDGGRVRTFRVPGSGEFSESREVPVGETRVARLRGLPASVLTIDEAGRIDQWKPDGSSRRLPVESPRVAVVSAGGRWLAAVGRDDVTVELLDLTSDQRFELRGHENWITGLAFSPDERRLASGSFDTTIRVWDLSTPGREPRVLRGHTGWVRDVAFAPDGRRLVSGSVDETVRVWDLDAGESRVLRGHASQVRAVGFSPDGRLVASADGDGTVRLWPDDLPSDRDELRTWVRAEVAKNPSGPTTPPPAKEPR